MLSWFFSFSFLVIFICGTILFLILRVLLFFYKLRSDCIFFVILLFLRIFLIQDYFAVLICLLISWFTYIFFKNLLSFICSKNLLCHPLYVFMNFLLDPISCFYFIQDVINDKYIYLYIYPSVDVPVLSFIFVISDLTLKLNSKKWWITLRKIL